MPIQQKTIIQLAKQGHLDEAIQLAHTLWQEQGDDLQTALLLIWLTSQTSPLMAARWAEKSRLLAPGNPGVQKAWQDLPQVTGKMLVERSGEVTWPFRKINVPIAQAIKENKITTKDLAWAASNASTRVVRWAAAVAYARRKIYAQSMTPLAARQVTWPFRQINQPIGQALEAHKIDFRDLCYAITHGRNELPMAAAIVAWQLLDEKDIPIIAGKTNTQPAAPQKTSSSTQPQSTPPKKQATPLANKQTKPDKPEAKATEPQKDKTSRPQKQSNHITSQAKQPVKSSSQSATPPKMQIFRGSTYLKEQHTKHTRKKSRIQNIARILIFIVMTVGIVGNLTDHLCWSINSIIILLLMNFIVIKPFQRAKQEAENYEKGLEGEKKAAETLQTLLNGQWTLFLNVDLPDKKGDIDGVLIGPNGLYALEIKAFTGKYRNVGDKWFYKSFRGWASADKNPSRQARRNAQRLHNFLLQEANIKQWVTPRVFWAGEPLQIEKPSVPVWQLHNTDWIQKDLMQGKPIDPERIQRIRTILKVYTTGYKHNGK